MTTRDESVVVCGAGGFIGGHLVHYLANQGYRRIRAVDCKPIDKWWQRCETADNVCTDLRERAACQTAVRDASIVFNLAADMGGMGFIAHNKARCMISVLINTHLLMAAKENNVRRYFFASSACVYNVDKQRSANAAALKEEDAYPAMPEDGYGWEKLFSERMCRHFREDFAVETRVARYHNVYGPHGAYEGGREKAPAAICRKVIQAKLTSTPSIEIWGDGTQTRSFQYVTDCVFGTYQIAMSDIVDPINLGSSEAVSLNQLVDIAEGIAGVKLKRKYDRSAPVGVAGRNSDNTRIRQLLGWEPGTLLIEGMEKTYRWIYDQLSRGGRQQGSAHHCEGPIW